ncbi:accessory factor associated with RNA polymerase II [Cyanidiococcus yangmingshanensis]|uniref:Accessory factor associated with RNA polymerase II n=1 Tax=Cyanidiococcus yangmingshanensis TaxID=2690220 RepID=A0A7J7IPG5_9RHOD|nr:accessory factor associated with RNA polymerase II [Cyanidiococcus yangmingshanensis]
METTQTTAPTKADLQAEKEPLDERSSVKEAVASSSVKIERDEHDVSASNQDTRHGAFDESAYVARCIAMERVQRSCDGFFELDKRKGIDFTTFPVVEALRKSVIAGPPEGVPAVENAAVSGRASVDGQPTLVTAKASDLDIARGDRYRTDPLRAYREAGLADLERLEIDPAAGFASVAASLLEPGSNALSARDSMETTLGESTAASTGRLERTGTPTTAGHGRDNGPAGVVVTKKHASAGGTQAQTGSGYDTLHPIIILPVRTTTADYDVECETFCGVGDVCTSGGATETGRGAKTSSSYPDLSPRPDLCIYGSTKPADARRMGAGCCGCLPGCLLAIQRLALSEWASTALRSRQRSLFLLRG